MGKRIIGIVAWAALLGCGGSGPTSTSDAGEYTSTDMFSAMPATLAFVCGEPGCDTTLTVKVNAKLPRKMTVRAVSISPDVPGMTVTTDPALPAVVTEGGNITLNVRFAPKSSLTQTSAQLLVEYAESAPGGSYVRIPAGSFSIPVQWRVVGSPGLEVTPQVAAFGLVSVGQVKEVIILARNSGTGNAGVKLERVDTAGLPLEVIMPTESTLLPGQTGSIRLRWTPSTASYLNGTVTLESSTTGISSISIPVTGTTYANPHLVLDPSPIPALSVMRGSSSTAKVLFRNLGSAELTVNQLKVNSSPLKVSANFDGGQSTRIPSFGTTELTMSIVGESSSAIAVSADLSGTTNDPELASFKFPFEARIDEWGFEARPASIDAGVVLLGNNYTQKLVVTNLSDEVRELRSITLSPGTSRVFALDDVPVTPARVEAGAAITMGVQLRGETVGDFIGSIIINDTNPLAKPITIPLAGKVRTCSDACVYPHAVAACTQGRCGIGTCETGYFNTDGTLQNGCECAALGNTKTQCSGNEGTDCGDFPDNQTSRTYSGNTPEAGAVRWYRFFARDDFQAFSDAYRVRVKLVSADPNLELCVYRHFSGTADSVCHLEAAPVCGRNFEQLGTPIFEDASMYYVKVSLKEGAPGSCTPFTLTITNG